MGASEILSAKHKKPDKLQKYPMKYDSVNFPKHHFNRPIIFYFVEFIRFQIEKQLLYFMETGNWDEKRFSSICASQILLATISQLTKKSNDIALKFLSPQ